MSAVFADTSYDVALLNPRDEFHSSARTRTAGLTVPIVTSNWVLTELANFLARGGNNRRLFLNVLADLRNDPDVRIVPHDEVLFEQGLALFARRPDKEWSLTDCTSFAIMDQYGLRDALTTDHHFPQAGYRALLVEAP